MDEALEKLAKALENSPEHAHEQCTGMVHYGIFCHDISIAGRVNEDGSETFGRVRLSPFEFTPFTDEEDAEFKRKFAWHFTKIFDRKNTNNVIQLPVRKCISE